MQTHEISLDAYADFLANSHAGYTFLQTPEFATKIGAKVYGGFRAGKLKVAVLVHSRPALKFFRYAYSPYDWVCQDSDLSLTQPFVKSMISTLRQAGFILWQVESCFETGAYDADGCPLNNFAPQYIEQLKSLGFRHNPLDGKQINPHHECVWGSVIDLKPNLDRQNHGRVPIPTNQPTYTFDELLSRMKSSKRRAIRQYELGWKHMGNIVLREYNEHNVTDQALKDYADLLAESAEKQHYLCKTKDQAGRYLKCAGDHGCLMIAYLKDGDNLTPFAGALFIWTPSEMYYYFAGMKREYGRYEGPTVIHGQMLKKALDLGLERYNLMGVSGDFSPESPNYGVYKSKKDLGGHIVHYAGVFNLPLREPFGSIFLRRLR